MSFNTCPFEVIENIIKIIEENNDLKSLYYLCLTNKILCKISIPYLWKKSLIKSNNFDNIRDYLIENINTIKIISILLFFIKNTNIRNFLKNNYKEFFYFPKKPIFNYPCFIKFIDFSFLFNSIQLWLSSNSDFYRYSSYVDENKWKYFQIICGKRNIIFNNNIILALTEMIFRSIIKYTDEINTIYINVYNDDGNYNGDYDEGDDFYIRLFALNDAKKCLSKLKKFKIKGFINNKIGIINQFMNYNPKLKIIYIQKYDSTLKNHQLMKFLLNQHHLTKITISGLNYEGHDHDMEGSITNSLESLKIIKCNVSDDLLRFFINCDKLKKFQLIDVDFISFNNILKHIIFKNLKDLKIISKFNFLDENENLEYEIKPFIIHHLNNLERIEIKSSIKSSSFSNFIEEIPSLILEYSCPLNLNHLFLQIDQSHYYYSTFLNILKRFKNLKTLELTKFYINDNNYYNNNFINYNHNYDINNYNNDIIHDIKFLNDQYLRDFTNNLNENLKLLNLGMWKISIESLKIILTHKRLSLKNLSCILYNGNPYHIERLIKKYKEFNHRNRIINNYTITKLCVDYYYYGKKSSSKDHKVYIEWVLK